jgi:hypothetical protein
MFEESFLHHMEQSFLNYSFNYHIEQSLAGVFISGSDTNCRNRQASASPIELVKRWAKNVESAWTSLLIPSYSDKAIF